MDIHVVQRRRRKTIKQITAIAGAYVGRGWFLYGLFSYKSEKTEYHLRDISQSLRLPKLQIDRMKKSMTEQNFGILFLKTSEKVKFFAKKSPLTRCNRVISI